MTLKALLDIFLVATEQSILESFYLYFLGNTFSSKTKDDVIHGIKLFWDVIGLSVFKHNIFEDVIVYQRKD